MREGAVTVVGGMQGGGQHGWGPSRACLPPLLSCPHPKAPQWPLTNLTGHGQALGVGDRCQLLVPQPFDGVLVVTEVQLGAHQEDGRVGAVVSHLWVPLWGRRL